MDRELVVRAQQGDEAAFGAIARVAYPRHLQVAYRILRHPQAAEDATQQAWIRTWRTLPRLREPERFDAWSYRILVNACLSESKRLRRWGPTLAGDDRRASPDPTVRLAEQDELEGAFVHLSIDQRVVIVLHFYLGLTLPEIASTLDVPLGTVNSRLGRALERLRRELGIIDLRPREQGQEATS